MVRIVFEQRHHLYLLTDTNHAGTANQKKIWVKSLTSQKNLETPSYSSMKLMLWQHADRVACMKLRDVYLVYVHLYNNINNINNNNNNNTIGTSTKTRGCGVKKTKVCRDLRNKSTRRFGSGSEKSI